MARPTMLNSQLTEQICSLIRGGNDSETAALASGVHRTAFYTWLARGRAEQDRLAENPRAKPKSTEVLYAEFADAVERARGVATASLVSMVNTAARDPKTWAAAAWLLERRDPQRWGKTTKTELSGPNGGPMELKAVITDRDLAAMVDDLAGFTAPPVIPPVTPPPE